MGTIPSNHVQSTYSKQPPFFSRAPDSPIKVIDFSLAAFFMQPMSPGGTPEFVAPELLIAPQHYAANGCGPAVDIWSAGIVLYYLLSGRVCTSSYGAACCIIPMFSDYLCPLSFGSYKYHVYGLYHDYGLSKPGPR